MFFFRVIFPVLFVLPLLTVGQTDDRRASELLVMRMRQSAETMIPRMTTGLPKEQTFQVQIPEDGEKSGFAVRRYAGGVVVDLPARFPDWAFSSEPLFRTAEQILRARLGTDGIFRDSWAAAAVVRSAFFPEEAFGMTGFTQAGYARIMTAHGLIPELSRLLDSPSGLYMSGMTAGAWTDWAVSLYELGMRSRIYRSGAAEQYFAARNTGRKGALFDRYLLRKLLDRNPVFRGRRDVSPQEWFETALSRLHLSQVHPCSPETCERLFRARYAEALRILNTSPTAAERTPEDREALARSLMQLNLLAMTAPGSVPLEIIRAIRTLDRVRAGMSEALPDDALVQAERNVYLALEQRSALEHSLRNAERRLIPPASRFALTFRVLEKEQPDTGLYREARTMLNRYEQEN